MVVSTSNIAAVSVVIIDSDMGPFEEALVVLSLVNQIYPLSAIYLWCKHMDGKGCMSTYHKGEAHIGKRAAV